MTIIEQYRRRVVGPMKARFTREKASVSLAEKIERKQALDSAKNFELTLLRATFEFEDAGIVDLDAALAYLKNKGLTP